MTINSSLRTAGPFTGNGATTVYPFAFKVFTTADLLVARTDTGLVQTTLALGTDYTVTLNADQNAAPGGSVVLLVALVTGYTLTITSNIGLTQPLSLTNGGGFFPKNIEDELDRLTILQQQLNFNVAQALRVPEIDGVSALPAIASRANNLLGFDSLGRPVAIAPATGSAAALAADLTSTSIAAKGAGQIGFTASLSYAASTVGRWLKDLALAAGSTLVGFAFPASGGVTRTVSSKLSDTVSVFDFLSAAQIADVQAQTLLLDCAPQIQQAYTAAGTKTVTFPAGWYRCDSTINAQFASRSVGEVSYWTRLVKFGGGNLFTFTVTAGQYSFENMRFGGTGATAFIGNGGGYTNYVTSLTLTNCDFEKDLNRAVDASLIYFKAYNCTFGFWGTTAYPGGKHIVSSFSGSNFTNVGEVVGCKFFNANSISVQLTGGTLWKFRQCDWSFNTAQIFTISDVSLVEFDQCYAEGNNAALLSVISATSAFAICRHKDWSITNGTGGNVFGYGGTQKLILDGNVVFLAAAGNVLYNNGTTSVTVPTDGSVTIKSHYCTGNAGDATVKWSGITEGGTYTWTPVNNGLTVVVGTGGITWTGFYSIIGQMCFYTIRAVQTGTCTLANSSPGVAYVTLPAGLLPRIGYAGSALAESTNTSLGATLSYVSGRMYPASFAAQGGNIDFSGWFHFS